MDRYEIVKPIPLLWLFLTFSLVLHPQHKLQYFKNAGWINDCIDTAEQLICTQFEVVYFQNDVKVITVESPSDEVCTWQIIFLCLADVAVGVRATLECCGDHMITQADRGENQSMNNQHKYNKRRSHLTEGKTKEKSLRFPPCWWAHIILHPTILRVITQCALTLHYVDL